MPWLWAASRWRALLRAALVLVASLLFTRRALAVESSFALTWRSEAKTQCVTEAELRARVARKLGYAPFAERDQAEIVIEGEEHALDGDRWRARIAQRDRSGALLGEREITAKSCEKLLRAATFVVALFIDPTRDQEPTAEDEAPAPSPGVPPRAASPPPEPSPAADRPRPPSRPLPAFDVWLGIGASAGAGLLPSLNGSLLALVRLERRSSPWSFDWTFAYSWPQAVAHGPVRGVFSAIEQRARVCFAFIDGPAGRVDACGGALWGVVIPRTTGVVATSDAWKRLLGPTAAIAFERRTGPLAGRLEAGIEVPVQRYTFSYLSNEGTTNLFYTTSGVVVFVAVGGLHTIFQ